VTLRGQLAGQFGTFGENDREALGGYLYLDRDFKIRTGLRKRASAISTSLATTRAARTMKGGTRSSPVAVDLRALRIEHGDRDGRPRILDEPDGVAHGAYGQTHGKDEVLLWYNYLRANEETAATRSCPAQPGARHLFQTRFDYNINKNVTTLHPRGLSGPGDYYNDDDPMLFTRVECQIKF